MTSNRHIPATTHYRQYAPRPSLAPYVACYWTITGTSANPATRIRVLPDGCMDAILDLTGGLAPLGAASSVQSKPSSFVTGIATTPEIIALPPSPRIIGIRFNPGGASPLLNATACELAETSTNLDDVMPGFAQLAVALVGEADTPEGMASVIDRLLSERLSRAAMKNDLTAQVVDALWHNMEHMSVNTIVREMGVNHKRLERTMRRHVGLPPKRLGRIMRFVAGIRTLQAAPHTPLARLSLDLGYTDQAHFSREFKTLSGLSPTRWVSEQTDVDFLQYTPIPFA